MSWHSSPARALKSCRGPVSPESLKPRVPAPSGTPVPYALAPDSTTCTAVDVPPGIPLRCPGCRRIVRFDPSLGRIGKFRHASPGPCPFDDPVDRASLAKERVRATLDAIRDGRGAWPWLVARCTCGIEAFRDLRGTFVRHEVGSPDDDVDFYLVGATDKKVLTLFVRDDPEFIRYLHDAYPHRFVVLDSRRALWYPGAWLLGEIRGVTNYRDMSLPRCPLCANKTEAVVG